VDLGQPHDFRRRKGHGPDEQSSLIDSSFSLCKILTQVDCALCDTEISKGNHRSRINIENKKGSCIIRRHKRIEVGGGVMCPACLASSAAIVAGAGSTAGLLIVGIGKLRKILKASGLGLFHRGKGK
jgi:hypothetical protein